MLPQSIVGLPAFLAYFCLSAVAVILYLWIYMAITPHNEFDLIRKDKPGAALSLGLSLVGFALPVASSVAHADDIFGCAIWSVIALVVQIIAYYTVRIVMPDVSQRIAAGEMAAAIWLGLASLTAGILSAASMTI
jgi:putative membrane protein